MIQMRTCFAFSLLTVCLHTHFPSLPNKPGNTPVVVVLALFVLALGENFFGRYTGSQRECRCVRNRKTNCTVRFPWLRERFRIFGTHTGGKKTVRNPATVRRNSWIVRIGKLAGLISQQSFENQAKALAG